MTRLIRYEFLKQFCKRSLLVLLTLFTLLDLCKIYSEYKSYSYLTDGNDERSWNTVHWRLYEEYQGALTEEKINSLLAAYQPLAAATADMTASTADDPSSMTGNLYSDRNLMERYFVKPIRYNYEYGALAEQIAEKARQNAAFYESIGQTYGQRESGAIYNLYAGRTIPNFAYREMCHYYLNYDFSIVLTLLLCLYGVIGTFVSEKETQMDILLLTNPNGGRKTALAKILAATAFLFFVSLWFSLVDFIGFTACYHTFEGLALPIYAITTFAEASVNISVFQYALLSAILRSIGVWVIGMVWLLVSMFWKNALLPFVIGLALCLGLIVGGSSWAYSSFLWAKVSNPYSLLTSRILLGKTEFLNIAGYPLLTWQIALCAAILTGVSACVAVYFLSAENWHSQRRRPK